MNIKILKQFILISEAFGIDLTPQNLLKYKNLRGITKC